MAWYSTSQASFALLHTAIQRKTPSLHPTLSIDPKQTGRPDFSGRPVRVKQTRACLNYERRRRIANAPIRPTPTNATVEGSGTAVNESGVNSGGKVPDCVTN